MTGSGATVDNPSEETPTPPGEAEPTESSEPVARRVFGFAWPSPSTEILEIRDVPRDREVLRFSPHQRAQHFLMMTAVIILVLTGMPQKFFEWPISQWMINIWGGLDRARTVHHVAGILMFIAAGYHLLYLLYTILVLKRPVPVWMFPNLKDFKDFFQTVAFYFGVSSEKPRYGRYSYLEKFDYWAVFWGVPIMGVTGLLLMYPLLATRHLPGVVIPVATIMHSDEAVLASGWLLTVHFYNAHLAPNVFPFNKSIFTGRIPEHLYAEEHAIEYEEMMARETAARAEKDSVAAG